MFLVEFTYNGIIIPIQCNENDGINEVCQKFSIKAQINLDLIYFSYGGKSGMDFNKDLTVIQMANFIDKENRKMNILVHSIHEIKENNNEPIIKSNDTICKECGENVKIKIEDYKISLYDCKNGHRINNLSFEEFENSQKIDLSKIVCGQCKENNKNNSHNTEFFKCFTCNIYLCPLCKFRHNTEHIIINDEQIKFICPKHNEKFSKYCDDCKTNICILCKKEHLEHKTVYLEDIIEDPEDLKQKLNELKRDIDEYESNINNIINILNFVKRNINIYYKITKDMVYNYDNKNRNYETLYYFNQFQNNNIINSLNKILQGD